MSLTFCDTVRIYFYYQLMINIEKDISFNCEGECNFSIIPLENKE
jgi:hypothetical protein